jgi:glucose dehydrogenase
MTHDEPEKTDDRRFHTGPWWWGLGPVGGIGLVVAVWLRLSGAGASGDQAGVYHQAAKVIAIGVVVAGGAMVERHRARASRTDEEGQQPPPAA